MKRYVKGSPKPGYTWALGIGKGTTAIPPQAQDWISIFLGILVEATPFLLLGVVVSALVHVFVSEDRLLRIVPKPPVLSVVPALGVGLRMPVCECGNVAVARRFLAKGVPISSCIAFLLATPILNPVALFATAVAFRDSPQMAWERGGLAFLIGATVGILVGQVGKGEEILARVHDHNHAHHHDHDNDHGHGHGAGVFSSKLTAASDRAGSESLEMTRVRLLGAAIAAATQVIIPRSDVTGMDSGIVFAILAMMSLGFVLSICSTVDAFFALAYSSFFPMAALLAFLVFGPMLGMKSTGLMLTAVRPRVVIAIAAVTAELVFLSALLIHLKGVLL